MTLSIPESASLSGASQNFGGQAEIGEKLPAGCSGEPAWEGVPAELPSVLDYKVPLKISNMF